MDSTVLSIKTIKNNILVDFGYLYIYIFVADFFVPSEKGAHAWSQLKSSGVKLLHATKKNAGAFS